ncbi:phasin [Hartmannibacter diazotrophicus]|uniref:Phasin n=1 Tax=Hartmannibacter diazotrophicus TaxID=1482074 RepID=A0A2C9D2V4_9HYPH|nr:phasin family protein [Hartmannibacter diazotrophicus]SON54488.1 phasin [Hartmannibacter diazotrophicus]
MVKKPTGTPEPEINEQMRTAAEKTLQQARQAVDEALSMAGKSLETLDNSSSTLQGHMRGIGRGSMDFAEQAVEASFSLVEAMTKAQTPQEVMEIQQKFVQDQMQRLGSQARSFGEQAVKTAQDMSKPFEK